MILSNAAYYAFRRGGTAAARRSSPMMGVSNSEANKYPQNPNLRFTPKQAIRMLPVTHEPTIGTITVGFLSVMPLYSSCRFACA